jgi:hypothetical protein
MAARWQAAQSALFANLDSNASMMSGRDCTENIDKNWTRHFASMLSLGARSLYGAAGAARLSAYRLQWRAGAHTLSGYC